MLLSTIFDSNSVVLMFDVSEFLKQYLHQSFRNISVNNDSIYY